MNALQKLITIIKKLRSSTGCPWDRAQNHQTLRPYLIEESYEALESLENLNANPSTQNYLELKEELGDVLLQVALHSELASEKNRFNLMDVFETLSEKLTRRHPHVFSDTKINTIQELEKKWEEIKTQEGKKTKFLLNEIPKNLPTLLRTIKVIKKVSKVGFQWNSIDGPLEKITEELNEFIEALQNKKHADTKQNQKKSEEELGDLLFSICNCAYHLQLDPDLALQGTLKRFEERFNYVEENVINKKGSFEKTTLEEMDHWWNEAKEKISKNLTDQKEKL